MPTKINCKVITILLLMVYFSACSNASEERNDRLFKVMEEGLLASNQHLDDSKWKLLSEVKSKLEEPAICDLMKQFEPKILKADRLSDSMNSYLVSLRDDLVSEAKSKNISKQQAQELYKKLKTFKEQMLWIDSSVANEFQSYRSFTITTASFDSTKKTDEDFYQTFFANNSTVASMTVLTKFQNNVKSRQYEVMDYLHRRVGVDVFTYDLFTPLVSINSQHFSSGEAIEIKADLGAYFAKPNIKIQGKEYKANNGIVEVSIKAPAKPCKHTLPIDFEWDEYGKVRKETYNAVYYVDSIPTKP